MTLTATAMLQDGTAHLPAAVLWDLDGTIVDTEPYWIECQFELVAAHGGEWSEDHAKALVGRALPESGRYLREHSGIELPGEQIVAALTTAVTERVHRHVPWRPGAAELLVALRALEVRCALVTMSYRSLAEAIVSYLPASSFDLLVTGDEVTHGKPHPEAYLVAAEQLAVDPAACLAIEDSPTGVASATAAGVPVLAVEHLVPILPAPGRHVVRTLSGVGPGHLGAWAAALSG